MKTVTKVAPLVQIGSGALVLLLGLIIWTGRADQLIPVHEVLGMVLVLSLWTIAAVAARSGISKGLAAVAVAWTIAAPLLGEVQARLLPGGSHWTIQVLHAVLSMGVVAWGRLLVIKMRHREPAVGPAQRPGHPVGPTHRSGSAP